MDIDFIFRKVLRRMPKVFVGVGLVIIVTFIIRPTNITEAITAISTVPADDRFVEVTVGSSDLEYSYKESDTGAFIAQNIVPLPEGSLSSNISVEDQWVFVLQKYLEDRGSPLAPYANKYVEYARKYDIPVILMPAIGEAETHSCTYKGETNTSSPSARQKNCWGIGGGPATRVTYDTWDEAIHYAVKLIADDYDTGRVEMMGIQRKYCGIGCEGEVWSNRVMYYVDKINEYAIRYNVEPDNDVVLM